MRRAYGQLNNLFAKSAYKLWFKRRVWRSLQQIPVGATVS
jgi:hypothetical protein